MEAKTGQVAFPAFPMIAQPQPMIAPTCGLDQPTPTGNPAFERAVQHKVVYYSDFDMDANDWRSEQQAIDIFSKFLLTNLSNPESRCVASNWVSMISKVLPRRKSDVGSTIPMKSCWEVALEYVLLTMKSEKVLRRFYRDRTLKLEREN